MRNVVRPVQVPNCGMGMNLEHGGGADAAKK